MRVSEGSPQITTKTAKSTGKSVSMLCTFKATYGDDPIIWSQSYKMVSKVK